MSMLALRRGTMAAKAPAGGGTFTIYASPDGQIQSSAGFDYPTARAGSGSIIVDDAAVALQAGQRFLSNTYYVWETFLSFDTSTVTGTVSTVTLSLYGHDDRSESAEFDVEARTHTRGATLEAGDWVAGADLSSKTLLAKFNTTPGWGAAGYNAFTSESAFLTAINQAGTTEMVICTSRITAGSAPTAREYVGFRSSEFGGNTNAPKLVVVTV